MPELPEVETVMRGIEPVMVGQKIRYADIRRPDLRWPFPENMSQRLTGAKILRLHRRSKYILCDLNSGETLLINAGAENGGEGAGLRPKAMMLASLAGCSGLDIASLIEKMKLEVDDFKIETNANLTEEHPKLYDDINNIFEI